MLILRERERERETYLQTDRQRQRETESVIIDTDRQTETERDIRYIWRNTSRKNQALLHLLSIYNNSFTENFSITSYYLFCIDKRNFHVESINNTLEIGGSKHLNKTENEWR